MNIITIFFLNIDASRKINFNMRLAMTCDASWVQFPTHFDLMYMPRAFAIRVDACGLSEGAYTTWYFIFFIIIDIF